MRTADGPLAQFAIDLRELRAAAGLTYRALGEQAHYSHTSLSRAAKGERLPSWETTQAFVRACGANPEEVEEWHHRWAAVREQLKSSEDAAAEDMGPRAVLSGDTAGADTPHRGIRRAVALALVLLVGALAAALVAVASGGRAIPDDPPAFADGRNWASVNAESDPGPGLWMLAELDPDSGEWDDEHVSELSSRQFAEVSACSPPRAVSYTLPPGVTRVSFKVRLGARVSPGLVVAVKITVDDVVLLSQPIQADISYAVDAGSLTAPQRLTIEWSTSSGNNGTGTNCASNGFLVVSDARLYR